MIHMFDQGSEEWRKYKCGRISASRIGDLMARTKSGPAASRKNYIAELVVERLTDEPTEHFTSREMMWGTEHEPEARGLYEFERQSVRTVGFIDHPTINMAGASPDGLVGNDGAVEIKCPNTATHIETLRNRKPARGYIYQMQWVMDCAERSWCDFVSYDPRVKIPELQLCIIRVKRDDAMIREIRSEVEKANGEIDEIIAELEKLR